MATNPTLAISPNRVAVSNGAGTPLTTCSRRYASSRATKLVLSSQSGCGPGIAGHPIDASASSASSSAERTDGAKSRGVRVSADTLASYRCSRIARSESSTICKEES
eukprot:scaffold60268_cov27-Tisochrysis_lutea.AAC.5